MKKTEKQICSAFLKNASYVYNKNKSYKNKNIQMLDVEHVEKLIRAFDLEHNRCENYFDRMYRTIQFTFVALIAIVLFAFDKNTQKESTILMLYFVLPAVLYVFGVMFTYNVYALAICGKRASIIETAKKSL